MALFTYDSDRDFALALGRLTFCNPFLPERIAHERTVLGDDFTPDRDVWTVDPASAAGTPNVAHIRSRLMARLPTWRDALAGGAMPDVDEARAYEDVVLYALYEQYWDDLTALFVRPAGGAPKTPQRLFDAFAIDVHHWLGVLPGYDNSPGSTAHLFALYYQVRRAFHAIFSSIVGASMPAARLRAAIWQSVFTHDMRRYRRALYRNMGEMPTLIAGPSGTGKELVARAIALARYLPYDPRTGAFDGDSDPAATFHAINLAALSPTLLESELFGHRKGAFTGATHDHCGWLETCGPWGTVFLDEIGEVAADIQVKLLRVLQTRSFQRLGETASRPFAGKLIAATNRDLADEMARGSFRQDLYYRLCGDIVTTPSLRDQLVDTPAQLPVMVRYIVQQLVTESEAPGLTDEVTAWIRVHLGDAYPWPGNFRELEQCVRNILIHAEYRPAVRAGIVAVNPANMLNPTSMPNVPSLSDSPDSSDSPVSRGATPLAPAECTTAAVLAGALPLADVERWYIARVHDRLGNLSATARHIGVDRRTVRDRLQAVSDDPVDDAADDGEMTAR